MTIVTYYSNPIQSPRGPRLQPREAAQPQKGPLFGATTQHQASDSVRFGKATYRPNGLWVTNERLPVKTGGLGEVSYTISKALAKFGTPAGEANRDIRMVVPYLKPTREQDEKFKDLEAKSKAGKLNRAEKAEYARLKAEYGQPFQQTNLTLNAMVKKKPVEFQVLQAFEELKDAKGRPVKGKDGKIKGNWVYALKNDSLFSNTGNIATYEALSKSSLELLTPFNEAAGKLVPYLDGKAPAALPTPKAGEVPLQAFDGPVNYVFGNDWLTGSVLYQPGVQNNSDIRKIFFLHNTYDSGAVLAEQAGHDRGWPLPSTLTKADDLYSHLTLSLQSADAMVANKNFIKTLTRTDFANGQKFVAELKKHVARNTVFDMHHSLADDFTPNKNEFLRANQNEYQQAGDEKTHKAMLAYNRGASYQFKELWGSGWNTFKKANKAALQTKYGLNRDPNAVVLSWAARLEPNQKGFYMVQNTIEKLLRENPKLQVLIAGNVGDPAKYNANEQKIDDWINKVNREFKGRVYIPNAFVSKREITQMNAGSDFTMLPSLYEPYGLTQLEAIMMGSIPLVNGVDGLRTTVSDLLMNGKDFIGNKTADDQEAVWNYGQTGILMGDINVTGYRNAVERQHFITLLKDEVNNSDGNVYRLNATSKHNFKTLRKTLTENLPRFKTEGERQRITALANRMTKSNASLGPADMAVLDLIHEKDRTDYLRPAETKFAEAVERCLKMSPRDRQKVRANGLKFLKEEQNWKKLVETRYMPLLDAEMKPEHRGTVFKFNDKPPFSRTRVPGRDESLGEMPTSFLGKTWYQVKAAFATIIYYVNIANWFKKSGNAPAEEGEKAAS